MKYEKMVREIVEAIGGKEFLGSLGVGHNGIAFHALSEHSAVGVKDASALGAERHARSTAGRRGLRGLTSANQLGGGQLGKAHCCHDAQCHAHGDAFEGKGLHLVQVNDTCDGGFHCAPLSPDCWYPFKSIVTDPPCDTMPISSALSGSDATNWSSLA